MGPATGIFSRAGQVLCLLLGYVAASAATTSSTSVSLDVGMGYESQSSPLFQVTPESTLVYIGGLNRLKGNHVRAEVQGFGALSFADGLSVSVNASASEKKSPQTPDLDFRQLSLTPSISWPVGNSNIGLGINVQRMDVAGEHFMDAHSIQADWSGRDGDNLLAVLAEIGNYRHPGDLQMLDSDNYTLTLQRNIADPIKGIGALEVTALYSRERNVRGFHDLSSRKGFVYAAITWELLGGHWSAGHGLVHAAFDEVAFSGEPNRLDRTRISDVAVEYPFIGKTSLKVEFNQVQNDSTTHLYDNRYNQLSMSVFASW